MLTAGLTLVILGLAVFAGAQYAKWVFRDGVGQSPATVSGGFRVGAIWAARLGLISAAVGAIALAARPIL